MYGIYIDTNILLNLIFELKYNILKSFTIPKLTLSTPINQSIWNKTWKLIQKLISCTSLMFLNGVQFATTSLQFFPIVSFIYIDAVLYLSVIVNNIKYTKK